MTRAARVVLADAEQLLNEFRVLKFAPGHRARWAGLVALLRAVGHVLDKVDGEQEEDPHIRGMVRCPDGVYYQFDAAAAKAMSQAIRAAYQDLKQSRPEPKIFWEFIEQERNNILKEYQSGACFLRLYQPGNSTPGPRQPPPEMFVMQDGPFAGHDAADVAEQAIHWWGTYLDRIDKRAAALRAGPPG